jgi:chorismate mutase
MHSFVGTGARQDGQGEFDKEVAQLDQREPQRVAQMVVYISYDVKRIFPVASLRSKVDLSIRVKTG